MTDQTALPNLFHIARQSFDHIIEQLTRYDIKLASTIEMREATGLFPYYNLDDGHIYMAVPDITGATGKLQRLFMSSLLSCQSDEELVAFFRLFIPRMVSHEIAHCLRHQYGLFDPDHAWHEEQIANHFSIAVLKNDLSFDERQYGKNLLEQALEGLKARFETDTIISDSYYDFWYGLNMAGEIDDATITNIQMIQKVFRADMNDLVESYAETSEEMQQRLEQRNQTIDLFKEDLSADTVKLVYYHLGWLYYDLSIPETHYLDEFAHKYLGRPHTILPAIEAVDTPSKEMIEAYYKAYLSCDGCSEVSQSYFYRRYYSLLMKKIQASNLDEVTSFFSGWDMNDMRSMAYLSQFVEPNIRPLLPHVIEDTIDAKHPVLSYLSEPTDARLWQYSIGLTDDILAANTLTWLGILNEIDLFQPLPPEMLLTLVQNLYKVIFEAGETIIWEHDENYDVFILIEGKVEVQTKRNGEPFHLAYLEKGAVFGEMAMFTEQPRSATIIADTPCTCLVLRASDFRYFLFKYPAMMMKIASILAQKIAINNTELNDKQ